MAPKSYVTAAESPMSKPLLRSSIPILFLASILLVSATFPMNAHALSATGASFLMSATPDKLILTPNSIRISIINVTAVGGFSGMIDLSVNPPAGISVTLNRPTLSLQSSPSNSSILTLNASPSVAPGSYPVTINAGVSGASQSEDLTLTAIVVADTPLPCGAFGTCLIVSDASITGPSYSTGTIHFTASGSSGTWAFANVTVPRIATSNVSNTHVLLNGGMMPGNSVTITGNGVDYFIFFNFTFHSPVNVDIQLNQFSRPANPLALTQLIIYAVVTGISAIITIVTVLVVRRKKHRATKTDYSSKKASPLES